METKKLAQGVKELRKRKGFSQEDLAKHSGLSLRTIQRVENGETEPTGETIKRISATLEVTPIELIDWDIDEDALKQTVKTRDEYLHIYDSKLIISKTPEIKDLVRDYGKSVNNVFKTLMVFFVFITIFTTLAIIFLNMGKIGLAINTGVNSFFFLILAFYIMLFTSGSALVSLESVKKIKLRKILFTNVVVIFHKESGRLKKRHLVLDENQVDTMKNVLLSEKLIEEKDIELKDNRITIVAYILTSIIIIPSYSFLGQKANDNVQEMMAHYGSTALIISAILLIAIIRNIIKPYFYKNNKPATIAY